MGEFAPQPDRFAEFSTPWFTLIGEHLQMAGRTLDYWRVERADSVIVLPLLDGQLLLPAPMYRPGVGAGTLDFPGGRCPEGYEAGAAEQNRWVAEAILERELGINAGAIAHLFPLNAEGWAVNSSFSNQRLYGWVAELHSGTEQPDGFHYAATEAGIAQLLAALTCLQCRALLLDWWRSPHAQPYRSATGGGNG